MASSFLLSFAPRPPLSLSSPPKPYLLRHHQHHHLPTLPLLLRLEERRRRPSSAAAAKNGDSADPPDRVLSAACYLYPFLDGVQYGRFVLAQFPFFQTLIQPLVPAIRLFRSSPVTPFLLFLTLYFAVVRNPSRFSRYVRFNTMQAIVLDVLLIFPDLLERSFAPSDGVGYEILQSVDSTVFFFLLVSLVYGSTACLLGEIPRLPLVADAADRQVL
ncbi:protein TIC 20-v, chloroplastic-like [Ananas comosus]|uniref:Protein TIC 20 n=1 Tax=Ananas comosus TaxID=4615 RepID=A0A6P5FCC3_ANACO|nr:protein TIC 20-v, chloroplastic-like [Ananas comosus]